MERLLNGPWGLLREVMSPRYAAPAAQYWADMYVEAEKNGNTATQVGAAIMGTLASTCSDEESADLTNMVLQAGWGSAQALKGLADLKKADDVTGEEGGGNKVSPVDGESNEKVDGEVVISRDKYPESAKHIDAAQKDGKPSVLTIDRNGAAARRKESLRGIPTKPGLDRDEYPPAMFKEGGAGASVRHIPSSDNRGSGSTMGHELRHLPDGARVKLRTGP